MRPFTYLFTMGGSKESNNRSGEQSERKRFMVLPEGANPWQTDADKELAIDVLAIDYGRELAERAVNEGLMILGEAIDEKTFITPEGDIWRVDSPHVGTIDVEVAKERRERPRQATIEELDRYIFGTAEGSERVGEPINDAAGSVGPSMGRFPPRRLEEIEAIDAGMKAGPPASVEERLVATEEALIVTREELKQASRSLEGYRRRARESRRRQRARRRGEAP